jgi:hypothetical protein
VGVGEGGGGVERVGEGVGGEEEEERRGEERRDKVMVKGENFDTLSFEWSLTSTTNSIMSHHPFNLPSHLIKNKIIIK